MFLCFKYIFEPVMGKPLETVQLHHFLDFLERVEIGLTGAKTSYSVLLVSTGIWLVSGLVGLGVTIVLNSLLLAHMQK